jgi:hypothetical protein
VVFNATPFIIEWRPMGITFHPAPPLYATTRGLHASQKKTLHFDPHRITRDAQQRQSSAAQL